MFKRSKEVIRAAGEASGLLTPSVADALAAASARRQEIIAAELALEAANEARDAALDRGAEDGEIQRLEADIASKRIDLDRAQSRLASAERRLTVAQDAEAKSANATARAKLDAALALRSKAARDIDEAAHKIAEAVGVLNDTDGSLSEAIRDGVASNHASALYGAGVTQAMVRHALQRAGALDSDWVGNKTDQPTATRLAERTSGALLVAS